MKTETWWSKHGGGIAAGVTCALVLGALGWMVQMDRSNTKITVQLESIEKSLLKVTEKLTTLNQIEKRVTLIETTRFTEQDAKELSNKCDRLESRITALEMLCKP